MNPCDPNVAEIILGFSVVGIGLRAAIAQLKNWLKVTGFAALLLTFVCCAAAVVIYMVIVGFTWLCFLFWTCLVFAGTQTAYRLSHR